MDTTFFLHALGTAAAAICFAVVLVDGDMLLAPLRRWLYEMYAGLQVAFCKPKAIWPDGFQEYWQLQDRWWWKPIWGCPACVSAQWGFWAYLYHYHAAYYWWQHIYFTSFVLLTAIILNALYSWTRKQV